MSAMEAFLTAYEASFPVQLDAMLLHLQQSPKQLFDVSATYLELDAAGQALLQGFLTAGAEDGTIRCAGYPDGKVYMLGNFFGSAVGEAPYTEWDEWPMYEE